MASLDLVKRDGRYQVRNRLEEDFEDVILALEAQGVGELLVQSVELDGTRAGPDLELASIALKASSAPIVYAGGVATLEDAVALWRIGIDGVAAGSWFVFKEPHDAVLITYPSRRKIIKAFEED
jgi:cyclase